MATKARAFGIVDDEFFDDPRYERRSDLAQKLYLRLWVMSGSRRTIGVEINEPLFQYLCRRYKCSETECENALQELATPTKYMRGSREMEIGALMSYDGKTAIMHGTTVKHRTNKIWYDSDKYPEEMSETPEENPSIGEKLPSMGVKRPRTRTRTRTRNF